MSDERQHPAHLSAERIQAFLDSELPEGERRRVQEHVDACARCASELQAWETLLEGLGELPQLEPSPAFVERVLEDVPVHEPLAVRARRRLAALAGFRPSEGAHPAAAVLQEYADGAVGGRRQRRIDAHLAECPRCRDELQEWEVVFERLSALPHVAPSPSFSEAVMARVRIPAADASTARPWARILDLLSGLVPKTPRAWGVAGAFAAVPVAAVTVATLYLLTHPVLTARDLAAFVWWRASDLVTYGLVWATGWLLEHSLVNQALEMIRPLVEAPGVAAAALAGAWALSVGALWILYRNLHLPSDETRTHVQV